MPARQAARYPFPRINGRYHQYASIICTINGTTFYDIASIDGISDKVERTKVKGLSRIALGITAGNYDCENLKLEFFTTILPDVLNVLDPDGGGYYDSGNSAANPLSIHLEIFEEGIPPQERDWVGMTVDSVGESYSEGHEPLKCPITFMPIALLRNRRNPIVGIDLGKFIPNQNLITTSV